MNRRTKAAAIATVMTIAGSLAIAGTKHALADDGAGEKVAREKVEFGLHVDRSSPDFDNMNVKAALVFHADDGSQDEELCQLYASEDDDKGVGIVEYTDCYRKANTTSKVKFTAMTPKSPSGSGYKEYETTWVPPLPVEVPHPGGTPKMCFRVSVGTYGAIFWVATQQRCTDPGAGDQIGEATHRWGPGAIAE